MNFEGFSNSLIIGQKVVFADSLKRKKAAPTQGAYNLNDISSTMNASEDTVT